MKEYKFLVISMFIFSVLLLLWADYDNKQTAKRLKESRIEERLRIAKEKNQQKDSTSIDIDSTFNNID